MIKTLYTIFLLILIQSCAPLIGAAGIASLSSASKEKGLGASITDTIISTKISNKIFKYNPDLIKDTRVFVNNGSVLLTGKVKKPENKIELTKIIWKIKGVREVNNEVQIIDVSSIKNIARDIASLSEIRARILTNKKINSLNFSVDVVNDIAYLSGIAENDEEMKLVKDNAASARFIKTVFNFIILNTDLR
jgi:osmotically-inducible protein OsmY